MRFTIIAASLVAASAFAAYAGDDDIMGSRYGNTTLVHETLGTSRIWYNKDHTFTAANWILGVSGKWDISDTKDGKQICLHYDSAPLGHPNPECEKIEAHKIGDKWTLGGRDFELVKGIQK
ncbi:MAG: hypothetical protein KGM97_03610 [Alphaproteobacteria bacterium]|nr:hypothetical protein [Alphaproteobacteria bacterium]MDE2630058.1 hypothetical protein [Alphaproteobacteria bacterium]